MLCSSVVRELRLGKVFEFTSMRGATLKGIHEPVALYKVRPGWRAGAAGRALTDERRPD